MLKGQTRQQAFRVPGICALLRPATQLQPTLSSNSQFSSSNKSCVLPACSLQPSPLRSPSPPPPAPRRRHPPAARHPPARPTRRRSPTSTPARPSRSNVNLVNVYFSVRDKSGFLTGLHKDDCQLLRRQGRAEDSKTSPRKKISPSPSASCSTPAAASRTSFPLEQESGAQFLKDVLTPKDEAFLISFDVNVDLLADYTNSPRELKRAIDKASINTGSGAGSITGNAAPRGTLLFDAVYLAAHEKLRPEAGRKILVLLTDGGDQGSQETLRSAIEAAQKANAIVYVILIADRGFNGFGRVTGEPARNGALACETGGRVINVGNNGRKLEEAFDQIQDELRTQYLASYTPKNAAADGKYRKLDIDCGKGTKVQARKGYYAIAGDTQE